MRTALVAALLLGCLAMVSAARADDDLDSIEQKALAAAAERVAPSVVRIETVGGLERMGRMLFGSGPTTGLVVDPQGYIASSAFNFVNKPASILVRLPDGSRKPAKLVATDHNRMIVLLKIESDRPLPVAEIAPEAEMRVGQWCVAVGRAFEGRRPNTAVGILSARGRIWGKAIQTDAAVSPNNYGGPLVDIRGRVMGVLVPLSPQSAEEMAGYEWYDSGIGFAVPAEHIRKILPQLKQGKDLYPGLAGVNLGSGNLYTGDSVISACRANSPAYKAGLRAGDRVIEIAGRKVSRAAEVKEAISRCYAGEKLPILAMRGDQLVRADVELTAKLEPYQHPLLGILPMRSSAAAGVTVRWVYPNSPATRAGIAAGDVLVALGGEPVRGRDELLQAMGKWEPGQEVEVEFRHGDATRKTKVKLDRLPESLPPEKLPPARAAAKPGGERPKTGVVPLKVAEFGNTIWAYLPEGYDRGVPHGLVVWLHGGQKLPPKDMLARWKPLCDRHDLVLVVPEAGAATGWQPQEAEMVEKLIGQVQSAYAIDPARVVVGGRDMGGTMACLAAGGPRQLARAVAVIDAALLRPLPEADPAHRLAVYFAANAKFRKEPPAEAALKQFRDMKLPVAQKDLGKTPRDLTAEELAELARWIDMLDRI